VRFYSRQGGFGLDLKLKSMRNEIRFIYQILMKYYFIFSCFSDYSMNLESNL